MSAIAKVGVIGAGTMGHAIAQAAAVSGVDVVSVDVAEAAMLHGLSAIATSLDRLVKKDKLTAAAKDAALGRIHGTTDYAPLKDCDLVLESATENAALKIEILRRVDSVAQPAALLAVMDVSARDFQDPKYRPAPLLQEMVAAGYLGRKSGRGFYHYG